MVTETPEDIEKELEEAEKQIRELEDTSDTEEEIPVEEEIPIDTEEEIPVEEEMIPLEKIDETGDEVEQKPGTGLNIKGIAKLVDEAKEIQDGCGNIVKQISIGQISKISPSKKVYAPWSPQVSEDEKKRDKEFFMGISEKLLSEGLLLHTNPEDANDLLVTRLIREGNPTCNIIHGIPNKEELAAKKKT